jgi:Leucine-rich repeat (LRR) protein
LDASNNLISTIGNAEDFGSLMLLSLENNLLRSLKPFSKISSLMEFCKINIRLIQDVANNNITDLFNIFTLKELPRIIILDFTGNPVCEIENYRIFTIYHLSRLKVNEHY